VEGDFRHKDENGWLRKDEMNGVVNERVYEKKRGRDDGDEDDGDNEIEEREKRKPKKVPAARRKTQATLNAEESEEMRLGPIRPIFVNASQ